VVLLAFESKRTRELTSFARASARRDSDSARELGLTPRSSLEEGLYDRDDVSVALRCPS
jgi:hypothetical protein